MHFQRNIHHNRRVIFGFLLLLSPVLALTVLGSLVPVRAQQAELPNISCAEALERAAQLNALSLFGGAEACAEEGRREEANALVVIGQGRATTDMSLLKPVDKEHSSKVGVTCHRTFTQQLLESPAVVCPCGRLVQQAGMRRPGAVSVGFAMHRMTREYVRRLIRGSVAEVGSKQYTDTLHKFVSEAVESFFSGYGEVRSEIGVQRALECTQGAMAVNFWKLCRILGFRLLGVKDNFRREEPVHYQEVVKFVSFLAELRVYRKALSGR